MLLFCYRRTNRGRNASRKRQHIQEVEGDMEDHVEVPEYQVPEDQAADQVEPEDPQPPAAVAPPAVSRKIGAMNDTRESDVRIMFLFAIREHFHDKKNRKN